MCIGAQKAATSWLWSNLKRNKDIWMPPRKELHYFDRSLKYPTPSFLASGNVVSRLFSKKDHNVKFREILGKDLRHVVKSGNHENILWYLRYFFGFYNDKWYCSLFRNSGGKIKGEVTPAYSILDLEDVGRIRSLFPELKIILILRDPIERAWSQVRFFMTGNRIGVDSEPDEILSLIDSANVSSRGEYLKILDIWKSCFPKEQIFIGFYDDIESDPSAFLRNVFEFLAVDQSVDSRAALNKTVNRSLEKDMPETIERYLAQKYLPELEKLAEDMPGYPGVWLDACKKIIARGPSSKGSVIHDSFLDLQNEDAV